MIHRTIKNHLQSLASQFPVIAVMGPRQSGKSTLVQQTFPEYTYITLEDLDMKVAAKEDPRHFFATYANEKGVILDEVQEVPELFSYMQGIVDREYRPGYFILTGSQNFLMYEKITQTLAGRIALLTLLPLTIDELEQATMMPEQLNDFLFKGSYPRLYNQPVNKQIWASNYISTYIEKDVRQTLNIADVVSFQKFIKLCAGRVGNLLNYAELARDCDISPNTAKSWISVLETSYIITLLHPYYKNFNKRVIKSPKLYFYDTGLLCSLLGIKSADELNMHPMRGAIFESLIITELIKNYYSAGQLPSLYFWRDVQGHEIDCIIEKSLDTIIPLEIKARMTITSDFFKGLIDWNTIAQQQEIPSYVIYAGDTNQIRKNGTIITWKKTDTLLSKKYLGILP